MLDKIGIDKLIRCAAATLPKGGNGKRNVTMLIAFFLASVDMCSNFQPINRRLIHRENRIKINTPIALNNTHPYLFW